ncbi:AGAP003573-PA-like protein [Anopheles sinensis]|uniref:AGAP003573-PA-like protein n=1 Tax=Anopheles sinensis TaxID=74873 RepID=A0A084VYU9_ANOSI|nr:AGAP003573-PA-like protein [Anopheles sinensis]
MRILSVTALGLACVLAFVGVQGISVLEEEEQRNTALSANMNNYIDVVMIQVGPWMNTHLVPMALPDVVEGFEHRPILITYHGELALTNGVFHTIHSVGRNGNAMMHYDRQLLRVTVGANIRQLGFTYDYSAHIMDLGPTGFVDVDVATMTFTSEFIIDLKDFYIFMQDFRFTNMGNLSIRFRGNILVDWLANIFVNVITTIFRNTITTIVSNGVRDFLQATLDDMNSRLQGRAITEQEAAVLVEQLKKMLTH